jgi:hypothetical protein
MTTKAYSHYMLLNNDVVLSHGFVQGMVAAQLETGAGIVAPCYDDVYEVQRKHYVGPAEEYVSVLSEESTDLVDGTCMLIPDDPLRQVGLLDERFHKFGWGGADDLCLRMRRLGHSIVVTRRSYLQHFAGATARVVDPGYRPLAAAELYLGMKAKYGRRWMDEFPGGAFAHHGRYEAWLHRKNRALAVLRTRRRVER